VNDHALAVDIADFQAREFGTPESGGVQCHSMSWLAICTKLARPRDQALSWLVRISPPAPCVVFQLPCDTTMIVLRHLNADLFVGLLPGGIPARELNGADCFAFAEFGVGSEA
jgi:hypothetical protein